MSNPALPGSHHVHATTTIAAPIEDAWTVIADFNAMYTWAPGIEDTESISDVERGVGAVRRNTAKGFGAIDQHVIEWREGESYIYRTGANGPFEATHTAYRLVQAQGGCECSIELSFDTRAAPSQGGPTAEQLTGKLAAGLEGILGALKRRVETGELVRPRKG